MKEITKEKSMNFIIHKPENFIYQSKILQQT